MTRDLVTNWSLARDMRAFTDNGHLILVIGSARELAGVPRAELLSGDMVRLHLGAMVDTAVERQALADLHSRLAGWTLWRDDHRRVNDLADLVASGRARAVMIGRSSLSDSARAELLRGDEGYLARMQAILALLPAKIGPAAWAELMGVFTPLSLAITLCAIALAISSGVGALVVLGAGIVMVGWSVFDAIGKIVEFCRLFVDADTPREQDRCAELLAQAIAAIGVGAMIALLTRGGAKAAQLRRARTSAPGPAARPRDPVNDSVDPRERARPVRRDEPAPTPPRRPGPATNADAPAVRQGRPPVQNPTPDQLATAQRLGVDPRWVKPDGAVDWPPNSGFDGPPGVTTLQPGTRIDRYGNPTGGFLSPAGTPFEQRALPPSSAQSAFTTYEVVKPLPVNVGPAAPWFGQPGGGTQYQLQNANVQQLIERGYIRITK